MTSETQAGMIPFMIEEAELSSITRQTLLGVDGRLKVTQDTKNPDDYSLPILTSLKNDQPILFDYFRSRCIATTKYRSKTAMSGYSIGTALGYDIMTSHISSLGRAVDVTPLHIAVHDPTFVMAYLIATQKGVATGERILTRNWFEMHWVNYRFTPDGELRFRRPPPESGEFIEQVNKAPTLLDYLRHLHLFFRANPEGDKQAVLNGIFDQVMIYRHRLEDLDGPDKRYFIAEDGTKKMPSSPADMVYVRQQTLKVFGKRFLA